MFRRYRLLACLLVAVLLGATVTLARTGTITFQPGPEDGQDTWTGPSSPGVHGDETTLDWDHQPACDDQAAVTFSGGSWQGAYPQWHGIGGLAGLVQDWVDHPDQNFGMVIEPVAGYYGDPYLWTSEYTNDPSLRPKLTVAGALVTDHAGTWSAVKRLYR